MTVISNDVKSAIIDWHRSGEKVGEIVYYLERLYDVRLTYEEVEQIIIEYKRKGK